MGRTVKVLGFNISRASAKSTSDVEPRQADGQGIYSPIFNRLQPRIVAPGLYEALREAIPVLDAAIDRLNTIDGTPVIVGEDERIVAAANEWAENVRVNDIQRGLPAFSMAWRNEVHEQGFGIGEYLESSDGRDIERLRVADSKGIAFSREESGELGWWYNPSTPLRHRIHNTGKESVQALLEDRASANIATSVLTGGSVSYKKIDPINKVYLAYRTENGDPYGVSLLRSMPFVAKILLTIENSISNTFERFGDPDYHVSYKSSSRVSSEQLEERRQKIATDFTSAITAKRKGQSADFVTAVDKDSDMTVQIIGANGQVIEVEMPARHVLEQIVAKTGLPPWVLGLIWGTSERLAKFQSEMLRQESDTRTEFERLELERIVAAMLRSRGYTWSNETIEIERNGHKRRVRKAWRVEFIKPNLSDMEAQARANFMNAQAEAVRSGSGSGPVSLESSDPVTGAKNVIHLHGYQPMASAIKGHPPRDPNGVRNLETRPIDNPALDRVENDAIAGINDEWDASIEHLVRAFGLSSDTKAGMTTEGFTFTDADKKTLSDELTAFVTAIFENEGTGQGAMAQAFARAWAQGVIDGYTMQGQKGPAGDLNNDAAVAEMMKTSRSRFTTWLDNDLTPKVHNILQAGADAGDPPAAIARALRDEMGGAKYRWERIARSEIAMAHDDAKRGEWQAEIDAGLIDDAFDFIPAPNACPVCMSKAAGNPYTLATLPRVVVDTHPSDRCTTGPASPK